MPEELFNDSTFLAQFPIWMLLHPTALSKGMLQVNGPDGERGFPIFTDRDLAERFKTSAPPLAHYVLGMAENREALKPVIEILEIQNIPYVALDPTNTRTRFVSLADFAASVASKGGAAD